MGDRAIAPLYRKVVPYGCKSGSMNYGNLELKII